MTNTKNQNVYLSVNEFSLKHFWPIGGLRNLIFKNPEGLEKAIRRVGRKVLIVESEFFKWVDEQNAKNLESGDGRCREGLKRGNARERTQKNTKQ